MYLNTYLVGCTDNDVVLWFLVYFAQMQWLFVNPSFLPFCQFFETALANLPSHILQVLLCYSVAIAASCKELVNPTIRTTRSTIFDDRREDGKCQLKVETICSFFNLSWYVKSWRSPPLKSSRICLKRSRSSTPSNTMHIALKKFKIEVVI